MQSTNRMPFAVVIFTSIFIGSVIFSLVKLLIIFSNAQALRSFMKFVLRSVLVWNQFFHKSEHNLDTSCLQKLLVFIFKYAISYIIIFLCLLVHLQSSERDGSYQSPWMIFPKDLCWTTFKAMVLWLYSFALHSCIHTCSTGLLSLPPEELPISDPRCSSISSSPCWYFIVHHLVWSIPSWRSFRLKTFWF